MASVHTIDKTIIITGAGSGFGRAGSLAASRDGARLVCVDINEAAAQATAKMITDKGGKAIAIKGDVASPGDWKKVLDATLSAFGAVDVLINNAGWSYVAKPNFDVTEAEYKRVFDINVSSVFHSVNVIVPQMIKQGNGGVVINVSSISAVRPRPGLGWYAATKAAVTTVTKALAVEYAPHNVRFNSISPVLSHTGLTSTFTAVEDTPENTKKFLGNIPLGRLGQPEDIAEAMVWLSSEKARFITGTDTWVDGGRAI
ncbi:3-ketoacyl-reductase [Meredithblackwellia eburnea MCA 4105]